MPKADLAHVVWRKSSRSSGNGQCVEVAFVGGAVATRDAKNPDGPVVSFPRSSWLNFARSFKD